MLSGVIVLKQRTTSLYSFLIIQLCHQRLHVTGLTWGVNCQAELFQGAFSRRTWPNASLPRVHLYSISGANDPKESFSKVRSVSPWDIIFFCVDLSFLRVSYKRQWEEQMDRNSVMQIMFCSPLP